MAAKKKLRQLEIIQSHRVRCAPRQGETHKESEKEREGEGVQSYLNLDSFRRQFSLSLCRKATPQQHEQQRKPDNDNDKKTSCNLIIYYGQGGVAASLLVAVAVAGSATCPNSPRSMIEWNIQTGLMAAIINQMMFN